MSVSGAKTPVKEQAPKQLTPAQTAKPYGTAAKAAASKTAKKVEPGAPESVADIAQDDTVKAMEKLEVRVKAVNANNIARVANSHLTRSDEELHPLMSLKTGKPIDKFPLTSAGIPKLSLTVVDAILSALEADRTGNEETKRSRVRMQIGLQVNPA